MENKMSRTIEKTDICVVCGIEREDSFHVVCNSPMVGALWDAMRESWPIPARAEIKNTGTEWFLHLLARCDETQQMVILMTFWRAWHCRNEVTHHKPTPPIEASRCFLNCYIESLLCIKQYPKEDTVKGKMVIHSACQLPKEKKKEMLDTQWMAPPAGCVKLNVDGSFVHGESTGGAGMVLRDDSGAIIFSSCHYLHACFSPLEAELAACLEGVALAFAHTDKELIIELDCKEGVEQLNSEGVNRSQVAGLIEQSNNLLHGIRPHSFVHVLRPCNAAAHFMAQMGRCAQHTAIWFGSGPDDLCKICENECSYYH
ncbi:uncharacterized protein [Aegilops tauschii subsp. strangulata]|uniref:uncharacterized protein n=1 Tax=Aegilops tauschii subsp. strangulata TaxID=200361 RepID=UPI003CC8B8DE